MKRFWTISWLQLIFVKQLNSSFWRRTAYTQSAQSTWLWNGFVKIDHCNIIIIWYMGNICFPNVFGYIELPRIVYIMYGNTIVRFAFRRNRTSRSGNRIVMSSRNKTWFQIGFIFHRSWKWCPCYQNSKCSPM